MQENLLDSAIIEPSDVIERMLIRVGTDLYHTLVSVERLDEIAVIYELTIEWSTAIGIYEEKTHRFPAGIGVSLNEAMLMKHGQIKKHGHVLDDEWRHFADDDFTHLMEMAKRLGIN